MRDEPKSPILCPECSEKLVFRVVRKTKVRFLACPRYPECSFTMDVPAYVHMLEAGAKPLPGMEGL